MRQKSNDLTKGNITKQLITFALPLLGGLVLQQLYNAVDKIIVGQLPGSRGTECLAAVGSTGSVVQMLIALFLGMSSGATVLISRFFGARDKEKLEDAVHTSMLLALIIGAILSIVGVLFTPTLLVWMNTPPEMLDKATTYLQIYFAGLIGLTVYNMGSAVLQAVGNSRYPLYFLLFSAVLNTLGDMLLILVFDMDVDGAAIATIFAQFVSAALVVLVLCRSREDYRLRIKRLRLGRQLSFNIARLGIPAALQTTIVSISNITVQGYLNSLGSVAVAGNSAANSLDAFLPLPIQVMSVAVTTFVSQNLGAGHVKRARGGVKAALILSVTPTVFLSIVALIFHNGFLAIFNNNNDVLAFGWQFMRVYAPFYFLLAGTQVVPGALRGAGDVNTATFASIGCFVALRQIYLFTYARFSTHNIMSIAVSYPATWGICAAIVLFHYLRANWSSFERELTDRQLPQLAREQTDTD